MHLIETARGADPWLIIHVDGFWLYSGNKKKHGIYTPEPIDYK
jgi:hypothetical protein